MALFLGSLQLGFIFGLLAFGIYITFRILNIPDLTAEGSFTLGLAVSANLTVHGHPFLGILCAILLGVVAGFITGLLQTKLYIHPVLAGILTMSGLYSINLAILGSSVNLSLIGHETIFRLAFDQFAFLEKDIVKLIIALISIIIVGTLLILFFKTHIGLCIRATGDNDDMVRASSINVHTTKILALAISNACIALSGAIYTQYQGFADINSGIGILVVGLASVIIGEAIFGKRSVTVGFLSAIAGSIIYRFIIALANKYSFLPPTMLRLVSAIIVGFALSIPTIRHYHSLHKQKATYYKKYKGGKSSC